MAENEVAYAGCSVTSETAGYAVTVYWRLGQGRLQEAHYEALKWTEVVDVILAELDNHRPGWAIGDGWMQPAMF